MSISLVVNQPPLSPIEQRKLKGRILKNTDKEMQVITTGNYGAARLLFGIAIDFLENGSARDIDEALVMSRGYIERTYINNKSIGGRNHE